MQQMASKITPHQPIMVLVGSSLLIVCVLMLLSPEATSARPSFSVEPPHQWPLAEASSLTLTNLIPIGHNFPIALNTGQDVILGTPGIAHDGTNFFIPWFNGADIYGARVSQTGTVLDTTPIAISVGLNDSVLHPAVVFNGTNFFVFWLATRSGSSELYGARITSAGTVLDPGGIQLTTGGNPLIRRPGIAFDGTNILVTWRTTGNNIYAARITPGGVNLDAPAGFPVVSMGTSYYPATAFDGTNYLVIWHDSRNSASGWDIYGSRVTTSGTVLDANGFVIADDPLNQEHATVGFDGTNYLIAWYDWRPNNDPMYGSAYGARVSTTGAVLDNPAFLIAERARGQVPVQVNCGGIDCLIVWGMPFEPGTGANFRLTDVYARRVVSGTVIDQQAIPASTSFGHQFGPVVGYGNGRYLLAWSESTGRDLVGSVYGQLLAEQQPFSAEIANQQDPSRPRTQIESQQTAGISGWVQENAPVSEYLNSGVAFSAHNAYAFGNMQVVHYDGGQ